MKIRYTFGGVGLFALSLTASALSLGQSQGQAVLGAPLDLVFQLEPDPGLDAAASCVAAEVVLGERRVDASRVSVRPLSTRVGQPAAVRVRASVVVDEPVVVVRLSAGCTGQMSRSYTFFAELPDAVAPSAMPLDIAQLSAAPAAAAAREPSRRTRPQAAAPTASSARSNATPAPAPAPRPRKPAPRPPAAPAVPAASAAAPATPSESRLRMEPLDNWLGPNAAAGAAAAGAAAAGAAGGAATPAPAASSSPAASTPPAGSPVPGTPAQGVPAAGAPAAGAPAVPSPAPAAPAVAGSTAPASATTAPADAAAQAAGSAAPASASDQALLALQAEMQALRAAEARNNANLAQMRSQLEALQSDQGSSWTIPLLAALAIALLVLAWLLMRLRSLTHNPPANAWLHSVNSGGRGDDIASTPPAFGRAAAAPGSVTLAPMAATPYAAPSTEDFGQSTLHASEVHDYHPMPVHRPRELVKPEDLFDVRQQAEFFTSVGEYEQAIAVLRKHIDEHHDSSPLAYLELLGLFYQLSRRAEYDALRTQFEQHFAARVPDMTQFAQRGASLAHHPEMLARIEALWPTEQVCELLEAYLLRDAGQEGGVLFDLEAFDDLLLLQAVARTTPAAMRGQAVGRIRTTPTTAPEPDPVPPTPPSALADVAMAAAAASTGLGQVPADTPWATLERAQTAAPALMPLPPVLEPEPLSLDIPSTFEAPQGPFARSEPLATESSDSVQPAVPSLLDIDLSDVGRFEPLEDLPEVEALPFDLEEFPKRSIVGSGVDQVVGFPAADPKLPPAADLELTPWEQDDSPDSIFSAWNAARTDRVIAKPPAEDGDKDKPEPGRG